MKIGVWDTGRGDAGLVRANVGEVLVERAETGLRDMGGVMYSNRIPITSSFVFGYPISAHLTK